MGKRIYTATAVDKYLNDNGLFVDEIIDGCLLDTLIIYHDNGITEIFEETYINEWSSGYARHIYRKGMPKRFIEALEKQEAERAYFENLQNGTFDILEAAI